MPGRSLQEHDKPAVIIVGAGLGGLMLAILLEQINVPYHVFERATKVKPLGSAMALGASILPVFEQLGLFEELKEISLPCPTAEMYNNKIKKLGTIDMTEHEKLLGYNNYIFARPRLYELMLKRVPPQNISFGKKVLRTEERDGKVFVYCSDGSSFEGDILVGADGAYSGVRQSLYKRLQEEDRLPKSDLENFSIGSVIMVGVAEPKDPSKYSQLQDNVCHFAYVLGGKSNRGWNVVSVPGNQICWALGSKLSDSDAQAMLFRNSEWGPESIDAMCKEYEDMPCPWGGTMGDVMNDTPRERISKVFLEEKIFKTWYDGKTVLLGDGAVNAMHDAIVLANSIYNMKDASQSSITSVFEEYYDQRYPRLDAQYKRSQALSAITTGQRWTQRLLRHLMLNYVPKWMQEKDFVKSMEYRPQLAWLPLTPNRGSGHVLPQDFKQRLYKEQKDTDAVAQAAAV
ncbi:hypothetical protein BGX31_005655 [Mortierella sp. GBA43]|nr:hypothetical protein BGX31_005655 [Mortierella sp. GBA43]